jgi:spore maturation protein CgeB
MRVVIFCHSLVSCWNHGNAHFLRGVCNELITRGHHVDVFEPADGWSRTNLVVEEGEQALAGFARAYPLLSSQTYAPDALDLDRVLDRADLVLVHEWSHHALVARLGRHRARARSYLLLFHDTHHRSVTDPEAMAGYDLRDYDGVLAFGQVIRDLYLERGWARQAFTWHEAADVRVFRPHYELARERDLVWVGNWGDEERTAELKEFLLEPVQALGLDAIVHGVRYPEHARAALAAHGIEYGGWLPNHRAAEVLARHRVTVHVPRRPYATALRGVPTIRMFEALACGIPLVSSPWDDCEGLFHAGRDYLTARDGAQMRRQLREVVNDPALAASLATHGRQTILRRHTCAHRVDELLGFCRTLKGESPPCALPSSAHHSSQPGGTEPPPITGAS